MSTLSSANVTDVKLVLKERTHMRLCIDMLIFTHNLGNWLIMTCYVRIWCRHFDKMKRWLQQRRQETEEQLTLKYIICSSVVKRSLFCSLHWELKMLNFNQYFNVKYLLFKLIWFMLAYRCSRIMRIASRTTGVSFCYCQLTLTTLIKRLDVAHQRWQISISADHGDLVVHSVWLPQFPRVRNNNSEQTSTESAKHGH